MGLLEEISVAAKSLFLARSRTAQLLRERNSLIVEAFEAGHTAKDIALFANVAPVAIYKIVYTPKEEKI